MAASDDADERIADLETAIDAVCLVLPEIIKELPDPLPDQIQGALRSNVDDEINQRKTNMLELMMATSGLSNLIFNRVIQHRKVLGG